MEVKSFILSQVWPKLDKNWRSSVEMNIDEKWKWMGKKRKWERSFEKKKKIEI